MKPFEDAGLADGTILDKGALKYSEKSLGFGVRSGTKCWSTNYFYPG